MIWVTEANGMLIYVSADWTNTTGQPATEAHGRGWIHKIFESDRTIVLDLIAEARQRKQPYTMTFRLETVVESGGYQWVELRAAPSILPDGTFLGHIGVATLADALFSQSGAGGRIGNVQTQAELMESAQFSAVEDLADQLMVAHHMADKADEKVLLSIIKIALYEVGKRLAQKEPDMQDNRDNKAQDKRRSS